jgi:hypothetical protein
MTAKAGGPEEERCVEVDPPMNAITIGPPAVAATMPLAVSNRGR